MSTLPLQRPCVLFFRYCTSVQVEILQSHIDLVPNIQSRFQNVTRKNVIKKEFKVTDLIAISTVSITGAFMQRQLWFSDHFLSFLVTAINFWIMMLLASKYVSLIGIIEIITTANENLWLLMSKV